MLVTWKGVVFGVVLAVAVSGAPPARSAPAGSERPIQDGWSVRSSPRDLRIKAVYDRSIAFAWRRPKRASRHHLVGYRVTTREHAWRLGRGAHQLRVRGLDNDTVYRFSVKALYKDGQASPPETAKGESLGRPVWGGGGLSAVPEESADGSRVTEKLSWSLADPNGPVSSVRYTLERDGVPVAGCEGIVGTSCEDSDIANDGTKYSYRVVASNTEFGRSVSSTSDPVSVVAADNPAPITGVSVSATGNDGEVAVQFNAPASNGSSSSVSCTANGAPCAGSLWPQSLPTSGESGVTGTLKGLTNGDPVTVTLQDCNGSGGATDCDDHVPSDSVTPYGPLSQPSVSTSVSGQTVSFTVTANGNGKNATVTVTSSGGTSDSFSTGTGSASHSYNDTIGYSTTDTIHVTVSDGTRSNNSTASASTGSP